MDKNQLKKLSKEEFDRVQELLKESLKKEEAINTKDLFGDAINQRIGRYPLLIEDSFKSLIYDVPFYKTLMWHPCYACSKNTDLKILEEFLERKLLIPILGGTYDKYNADFMDILIRYPFISVQAFYVYKQQTLYKKGYSRERCPDCFKKEGSRLIESCKKDVDKAVVATLIHNLDPPFDIEKLLLDEIEKKTYR